MAADRPPGAGPAAEAEVERRLAELDELLAQVEALPGPAGALALEAVAAVVETYGAALARALSYVSAAPGGAEAFVADPLLGHLLLVHGLHPDPVEVRVRRVLGEVSEHLGGHGGEVELVAIADGTAEVRVAGSGGCGSPSPEELTQALREVVLAAAPELGDVVTRRASASTFIPLDALLRTPAGAQA
jgi:Fe-S cluster biogenesis protein NfuA